MVTIDLGHLIRKLVSKVMDTTIIKFAVDHWPVCVVIVLSGLLLFGLRALVEEVLPGDREMRAVLKTIRDEQARHHQQSRCLIDGLAKLALKYVAERVKVEDDSTGLGIDSRSSDQAR